MFYAHVYSHHAALFYEHAFSYHVDVLRACVISPCCLRLRTWVFIPCRCFTRMCYITMLLYHHAAFFTSTPICVRGGRLPAWKWWEKKIRQKGINMSCIAREYTLLPQDIHKHVPKLAFQKLCISKTMHAYIQRMKQLSISRKSNKFWWIECLCVIVAHDKHAHTLMMVRKTKILHARAREGGQQGGMI